MNVNENLIKLLNVPQKEISEILLSSVGLSSEQSNMMFNNWILEKILLNYENIKDNITIISFLSVNGSLSRFSDIYTRITVFKEIMNIDFYNIKGVELMVMFSDKQTYIKELYYIFIAQLDLPPPIRRIACLNLLHDSRYFDLIESSVESVINSNSNIIDKYYFLTMLVFMYKYTNITIMFKKYLFQINDENNLNKHYEQCILITGDLRNENIINHKKLKELSKIAINGNSRYYIKEIDTIYSYHNSKKYHVKFIEKDYGMLLFKAIEYTEIDYYCMIGVLCDNAEIIESFFSANISHKIVIKTGIFLMKSGIISAIDTILYFVSNTSYDMEIRIMIAKSLLSLDDKQYFKSAHDILQTNIQMMDEEEVLLFHSLLE